MHYRVVSVFQLFHDRPLESFATDSRERPTADAAAHARLVLSFLCCSLPPPLQALDADSPPSVHPSLFLFSLSPRATPYLLHLYPPHVIILFLQTGARWRALRSDAGPQAFEVRPARAQAMAQHTGSR